jgi:hypothetical protein
MAGEDGGQELYSQPWNMGSGKGGMSAQPVRRGLEVVSEVMKGTNLCRNGRPMARRG